MRTLEDIRGNCYINEDGHWLWRGSLDKWGRPRMHAPDYTHGGEMKVQPGLRAVWHCAYEQPIPKGHVVYGICEHMDCCYPKCIRCGTRAEYGLWRSKSERHKNNIKHILANRAISRGRSKVTPELMKEIQTSPENGRTIAARLGLSTTTICKVRKGKYKSFADAGLGVFSGLITQASSGARV